MRGGGPSRPVSMFVARHAAVGLDFDECGGELAAMTGQETVGQVDEEVPLWVGKEGVWGVQVPVDLPEAREAVRG